MKNRFLFVPLFLGMLFMAACSQAGGPQPGMSAGGQMIDKSRDAELNQLLANVLPKFRQLEYKTDNISMPYNLFVPEKLEKGKKYPLVLFMADASTVGRGVKAPLEQGYGALLWATEKAQAKNPCYVLVPQFGGVAVNDEYAHSPEVEAVLDLLKNVVKENAVDPARLYTTGQSMGGMISMYFNIAHPDVFAASLFVDCHWDSEKIDELVKHPFIFVSAGDKSKSRSSVNAIEEAARKMGVSYTWSEWSARLPLATQDELASTMLDKGQPINLIGFENGTVLPENGQGSEHMYSFDHAYQLTPVRDWLFKYSLSKPALGSGK